jgi:protein-S-isoprenylcysteine O-methyltransferase Ste14
VIDRAAAGASCASAGEREGDVDSEAQASSTGPLTAFFENHRILVSRLFAAAFLGILLAMEPRFEGSLVSAALFFAGLLLVGVATIGRLWCSLYISGHKGSSLITVGPYSVTRHPLYFFSFLGFTGVGLATETVTLALAMACFFAIVYPLIIQREESSLRAKFGAEFVDYCVRVPRFVPKRSLYVEPPTWVVDTRRFRRTMLDVVWFVWLVALAEFVEAVHELGIIKPWIALP